MRTFQLPYGTGQVSFQFEDNHLVDVIIPQDFSPAEEPQAEVSQALSAFVNGGWIENYSGAKSVAIAINDKTRPVPHQEILSPLVHRLEEMGISPTNIRFFIATGTHHPMDSAEFSRVLPADLLDRCPIESHDCDETENLTSYGKTPYGTPVWINRRFMEADLRIAVGNIEPHHFMGFSGGVKTVGIGLAGRETININHALLMHPDSRIGNYETNPIRQDLEDIGRLIDIELALNVVLNGKKQIVRALAGSPLAVMQAGVPIARQICQTPVGHAYDLVIASPGGAPKDINLYQAQKAITHASLLTRDGGVIILAAACPEGSGSPGFEQFMEGVQSFDAVFEKTRREGFRIGPHKAFQIARDGRRIHIILLSSMDQSLVQKFLLEPASDSDSALQLARNFLPQHFQTAILPRATNTIPVFE